MKTPALSPERRLDLFLAAWMARRAGDYVAVRDTLAAIPVAALEQDLDLAVMLAQAYAQLGQTNRARVLLERIRPSIGPHVPGIIRVNFTGVDSGVLLLEGRLRDWGPVSDEFWTLAVEFGTAETRIGATLNMAVCAALLWDLPHAVRLMQRALDEARHHAVAGLLTWCHHNLARAYRQAGLFAEAQRHLEATVVKDRPKWMTPHWYAEKAALLLDMGDDVLAEIFTGLALEHFQAAGSGAGECETRQLRVRIAIGRNDLRAAEEELAAARASLPPGNRYLRAQVAEEEALLAVAAGDARRAAQAAARARKAFSEMGAPRQVQRMEERLQAARDDGGGSPRRVSRAGGIYRTE